MKFLLTALACIIFAPAGLLWLAAELIYLVAFALKLGCSLIATVAMAVSCVFDKETRDTIYKAGLVATTKYLIEQEIADQLVALRLSSGLIIVGRKD